MCRYFDMVVRQATPAVRPDDVLTGLRSGGRPRAAGAPRVTRLAQGPLDVRTGEPADPFDLDRDDYARRRRGTGGQARRRRHIATWRRAPTARRTVRRRELPRGAETRPGADGRTPACSTTSPDVGGQRPRWGQTEAHSRRLVGGPKPARRTLRRSTRTRLRPAAATDRARGRRLPEDGDRRARARSAARRRRRKPRHHGARRHDGRPRAPRRCHDRRSRPNDRPRRAGRGAAPPQDGTRAGRRARRPTQPVAPRGAGSGEAHPTRQEGRRRRRAGPGAPGAADDEPRSRPT